MKKNLYIKPLNKVIDLDNSVCDTIFVTSGSEDDVFDAKASNVWVDDDDLDW